VSFYASVLHIGTTSVTIKVDVEAARAKQPSAKVKVTAAEVIYVAVDEAGKPISLK